MTEMLPLFPLGTVLYPGLVLPLNIFEQRYRQLVRDLLDGPEPRRFGVIAIREGRETGITGVSALYEVGCLAMVREVNELSDGRYELITVGTDRFKLHDIDDSQPYLRGELETACGGNRRRDRSSAGRNCRTAQFPRLSRCAGYQGTGHDQRSRTAG